MSDKTGIEWTDSTWNPWYGCTKVSPACDNCYMFTEQRRYGNDPEVVKRSKTKFTEPLRWKDSRLIFTCSWSDWFHKDADAWRPDAWDVIRKTPHHVYQILTKRPHRIAECLPPDWGDGYGNVWLGVSVENQAMAFRMDMLRKIPARVRFVSAEPLLGPLVMNLDGFHWVIAGGESGPNCRPTETAWLESVRQQVMGDGLAFFLKQLGGHPNKRDNEDAILDGIRYDMLPLFDLPTDHPLYPKWGTSQLI